MHALQDIGERLVDLTPQQLAELTLPEALHDAIAEAKTLRKFEARRRQLQYIGKLMREVDVEPIKIKLDAWRGLANAHSAKQHAVARWRARLLEDDRAFGDLAHDYPHADLQHLRALVRNALHEREANGPPRNFRLLFQELRALIVG